MQPKSLKFAQEAAARVAALVDRLKDMRVHAERTSTLLHLVIDFETGAIDPEAIPDLVERLRQAE